MYSHFGMPSCVQSLVILAIDAQSFDAKLVNVKGWSSIHIESHAEIIYQHEYYMGLLDFHSTSKILWKS
jgi:hypothetical protein